MANMTPEQVVLLIDKMTVAYRAIRGTSSSGLGVGPLGGGWGATKALVEIETLECGSVADFRDLEAQTILGPSIRSGVSNWSEDAIARTLMNGLWSAMNAYASKSITVYSGIVNLDSFMAYYNYGTGGPWECLAPPDWSYLVESFQGAVPDPKNVGFVTTPGTVHRGGTISADGMGKLVATGAGTGTFTDGFAVDTDRFAGGFPMVTITGLAGSGIVSVTGKDENGTLENYAYTASGDGTFPLVPVGDPDHLITDVTAISIAAGITGGTFIVSSVLGRTYPPT